MQKMAIPRWWNPVCRNDKMVVKEVFYLINIAIHVAQLTTIMSHMAMGKRKQVADAIVIA